MKNKKLLKHYLIMFIGSSILSFGLFNIHSQSQITEGGVLGTVLLLQHWLHISPSISELVLDFICYFLGWKLLGSQFFKNAIFASFSFSFSYTIWENIGHIIPNLSNRPFIAAILGATFVGLGVGLVVREGGASGGDDVLAILISKYLKIRISKAYLFTDITVLTLSLSYIPFKKIAFSLLTVTLSSFLIEKVQNFDIKNITSLDIFAKKENI